MRRQRAFIGTLATLLYLWAAVAHALSPDNTAVGQGALGYNTTGNYNTAVGQGALGNNRTSNSNIAVGQGALYTNTSGADNTALGTDALSNMNGSGNIAIGRSAGRAVTRGDNNIYIGHPGVSAESGVIRIGDERHDRTLLSGAVGVGTASPVAELDVVGTVQASTVAITSDTRLKTNIIPLTEVLAKLAQLRGVSFEWNDEYKALGRGTGRREIGVLAQDVEAVFPELVTTWGAGYKAVDYGKLSGVLIEAMKELQANTEAQLATQGTHIAALQAQVEALENGGRMQLSSIGWGTGMPFVGGFLLAGLVVMRRGHMRGQC